MNVPTNKKRILQEIHQDLTMTQCVCHTIQPRLNLPSQITLPCGLFSELLQSHDESCFRPSGPMRQRSKDRSICDGTQTAHQCATWRSFRGHHCVVYHLASMKTMKSRYVEVRKHQVKGQPKSQTSGKHLITNPSPFECQKGPSSPSSQRLWRFQGNWTLGSTEALAGRPRESLPHSGDATGRIQGKMMDD